MPPIADISQSQLGSRFWITKDTESFQKIYDNSKLSVPSFSAPHLTRVKASDRRMLSLTQTGVSDKLKNVFGQAKAFAEKIDVESHDFSYNTKLLGALGDENLESLAKSVVRILVQDEVLHGESEPHKVQDEIGNAKNVLKLMLATDDFKDLLLAPNATAADKAKVRLALVNAAAGALRLVWDGNATYDSIFELSKGDLFDLAKGTDVYRLAVATAAKARETFIDAAGLKDKVDGFIASNSLTYEERNSLLKALDDVVTAREEISGVLGKVKFDVGDGKTATVEKKLKEVRERMRAFRYDIDRKRGSVKAGMEGVRRWFDDINGVQDGREKVEKGFAKEAEAVRELNKLLKLDPGANNRIKTCLEADTTTEATNLTHTANNEIRYYFTGKERRLDVFSAKAHEVLGEMKNGESRTVKLTLGGTVAGKLGVADAEITGQYARTVKVSKSGGEYVLTLVEGAEVEGKAAFGASPEEHGVGGGVTGAASIGGKKSVSYKSVSDLIADLKGEDQVVSATSNSTRLCLGNAWAGLKKVGKKIGNGLLGLATTLGFREHHSLMNQNAYQAALVNNGIIAGLDRMLAANQHAVKTVETKATQLSGGFGGFVSGNVAAFGAFDVSGGVSAKYTYSTDRSVESVAYRPLTEKLAFQSDESLLKIVGNDAFEAPHDLAEVKSRLKGMEERMRQLEGEAKPEDCLDEFAGKWKKLAAESVLLVRQAEAFLAGYEGEEAQALRKEMLEIVDVIAFHLDRPRVTMTDQEFDTRFLEKLFTDDDATVTHTGEVTVSYNVIDGLTSMFNGGVGLPGEDDKNLRASVASRFVNGPTQTVVNTTLPTDQTVSAKVTTSHKARRDDVRPWVNDTSTDVEVSCSANLTVRAICLFVANQVFKGEGEDNDLSGEAPELKELFLDDMRSNLADAEKDFMEKSFFDVLGRKLKLPKDGEFGSDYDNTNYPTLKWHFENGRLVSISEVEKGVTKGSLSFGVEIHGVKVGLKAESTLTEVSMRRKMIVKPPLTAVLAKTETVLRAGKGLTSVEEFLDKDPESTPHTLYRLAKMFRADAVDKAKDPRFEKDSREARKTLTDVLTLLTKAKAKDEERFGYRVDALKANLDAAFKRLGEMNAADIGDEAKRAKVLHLVARILTGISRAYTLAKEAGFKVGDERI